jgi:hypothetical protein
MHWLPRAVPILVAITALDLAMVFGLEGVRVLGSPLYGLDQRSFSGLVHGIGWLIGVKGAGLFSIAAIFGMLYVTIAVVLALYIASRIAALRGAPIAHDLLDAGLVLVVIVTTVAATPAMLQGASEVWIHGRLPLWLVGLAATLSMIERLPEADTRRRPLLFERSCARLIARYRNSRQFVVSPAIRDRRAPQRWNDLRGEAGMVIAPEPQSSHPRPWFTPR